MRALKGLIEGHLWVEVFLQAVEVVALEIHASTTMGGGRVCRVRRKRRFESKAGRTHDQTASAIWKDLKTFSLIQDSTLQMSLRFLLGPIPSLATWRWRTEMLQTFFPGFFFFFFHPSCHVQRCGDNLYDLENLAPTRAPAPRTCGAGARSPSGHRINVNAK